MTATTEAKKKKEGLTVMRVTLMSFISLRGLLFILANVLIHNNWSVNIKVLITFNYNSYSNHHQHHLCYQRVVVILSAALMNNINSSYSSYSSQSQYHMQIAVTCCNGIHPTWCQQHTMSIGLAVACQINISFLKKIHIAPVLDRKRWDGYDFKLCWPYFLRTWFGINFWEDNVGVCNYLLHSLWFARFGLCFLQSFWLCWPLLLLRITRNIARTMFPCADVQFVRVLVL